MDIRTLIPTLLLLPAFLNGEIIETADFENLLIPHTSPEKVLVVCDIDNTLLRASQQLGSVAWSDYYIEQLIQKGIPVNDAAAIESMLWKGIQPSLKVESVDSKAPKIIQELQRHNFHVLALTARTPEEATYTFPQLATLGIEFKNGEIAKHQLSLENRTVLYEKGVLFATPFVKKSQALFAFLETQGIQPACIVFVDDKMGHIKDLEKACEERGIEYYGFRFSGADPYVQNFDPLIAEIQWEALPAYISDEQAKKIALTLKKRLINSDSSQTEMPRKAF